MMFIGCSKTTVVLLDSGKSQNAILVSNNQGETKLDKVGSYVDMVDKNKKVSNVEEMSKDEIASRFSKVLEMTPLKPITYILYFKPNSTILTEDSSVTLKKALASIKERAPCSVDIIGHTDTVGSHSVNAKVSLSRAKAIEKLVKQEKLEVLALVSKGFGEEDLLVQTKNNVAEAKNRNVEIFIK
ncbi:MAG: Unknown protein [uncultured Sulfurovum sp.]|uniref:OmpA-like domain-containing protein n=1 Tax=uncultured Sulfurovum sp. TaxID=269237 RepID=A0A6S6UD22_9BACT|nr:MAG: Unknown protein [uncultured Sulfurovum sp.]